MTDQRIFSIVPLELAGDRRLAVRHLRVLTALFAHRSPDTNLKWPQLPWLVEVTSMQPDEIATALDELKEYGWLKRNGDQWEVRVD